MVIWLVVNKCVISYLNKDILGKDIGCYLFSIILFEFNFKLRGIR